MATGTISNDFLVDIFEMPAFSISAGSPGTYATGVSCSIAKNGYRPIACGIASFSHPRTYFPVIAFATETAYASLYRTVNDAVSQPAGDLKIRVVYRKN